MKYEQMLIATLFRVFRMAVQEVTVFCVLRAKRIVNCHRRFEGTSVSTRNRTQCAKHRRLSPVFTFVINWHMMFLHSYASAKESNVDNHSAAWYCGVFFLSTKGAGVLCFVRVGSIGCWWGLMSGATGVSGRETDCPQIWNTAVCHQSA
jgi:hypothetical protein